MIRTNDTLFAVVGKVENVKTVMVPNRAFDRWSITTFDLEVTDAVKFSDETGRVRCITVKRYFYDEVPPSACISKGLL